MMIKDRNLTELKSKTYGADHRILKGVEAEQFKKQLHKDWRIINGHHLERTFKTKNFNDSLILTNKIGILAAEDNHHPEIELSWEIVKVNLFTHEAGGLSKSDFILASKIDYITL